MKTASLTFCALLITAPASAQGLGDLLGQVQTNAKASAFDAVVGSQAPALSGLTQNLSPEQKARLLDFGLDNAGTIGQVAAGASALGVGNVIQTQPVQPAVPAPSYGQAPSAYGAIVPLPQHHGAPAPAGTITYQTYPQPAVPAPAYGTIAVPYGQPPAPAYQQPAPQQDLVGTAIQLGIGALGN